MTKQRKAKGQGKLFSSTGFGKTEVSYHSGPNPELGSFVEKHAKPYDPDTDDYHRDSFNPQIRVSKADPIYNMHTYWSKKHYKAIMQYIEHFTEPGDLVLDQFCGSGMTGVAALATGRIPILIDLSPAATFITRNYCDPVDPDQLQSEFDRVMKKVKPELDWLYETRCDRCGGRAITGYVVWSERFQCDRCLRVVPLYDCPKVEVPKKSGDGYKTVRVCPYCLSEGIKNQIDVKNHKHGRMPVEVSYLCLDGCSPKRDGRSHRDPKKSKRDFFEKHDLRKLEEIQKEKIPHWYPTSEFPRGLKTTEFFNKGMPNVSDIFTKRNLWALSAFFAHADDDSLRFLLSAILFNTSLLYMWRPSLKGGIQKGTYYVPAISQIMNVARSFTDKLNKIKKGVRKAQELLSGYCCISTQSATHLGVPANSVDYIFTDPSYGDAVQYGELNFVWEAWLGFDTSWITDEIIVNPARGLSDEDWAKGMHAAMEEAFRVLKPGRWASICFHATSLGVWHMLQDVMADVGFVFDKSELPAYIDPEQKSYNQLMADKVVKRDLVLNFRKPTPDELRKTVVITGKEDSRTIAAKVKEIVTIFLREHEGATKDHIWDHVVSYLVQRKQMEPHDFEAMLHEVAIANDVGQWFLKEEMEDLPPSEMEKEERAAATLEEFVREEMERKILDAVEFSDIFVHYLGAVADKPRRELKEFISDYLMPGPGKGYRPPTEEEREILREARQKGLNRQIRRYVKHLTDNAPYPEDRIPDSATLANWLSHCRRTARYEDGVVLFEKGGLLLSALDEVTAVEAEEDYQVCKRKMQD